MEVMAGLRWFRAWEVSDNSWCAPTKVVIEPKWVEVLGVVGTKLNVSEMRRPEGKVILVIVTFEDEKVKGFFI